MSISHYRAFNLNYAKDGAPYKTRDGEDAAVTKWDGSFHLFPLLGHSGNVQTSNQWDAYGVSYFRDVKRDLVMIPLGFMEGDPVYAGDTIRCGKVILKADPKMRDFSAYHWPTSGEVATPVEKILFEHNLTQVYKMLGVNEYTEALDEIGSLQTSSSALRSIQDVLGVSSYAGAMQAIGHLRAENKSKSAENKKLSDDLTNTMCQRDHNCEMADSLANAISSYFCEYVGEHSNVNCPWKEALATIGDASGKMFVAESVVLDVAKGVFEEALRHVNISFSDGQASVTHGVDIRELMADAFAVLRRDQAAEKAQETESETKNPAGFGHG